MIFRNLLSLVLFASSIITTVLGTNVQGLKVDGNQIKNSDGDVVVLRGVNRPGTQYKCVQPPETIWDGDTNSDSAINALMSWKMNAIRLPLNEDCWTGNHGAAAGASGSVYKKAITDYVTALTSKNIAVIVDLHWNSNTTYLAISQLPMPSTQYSVPFWADVAATFAGNGAVVFDIFNEPVPNGGMSWDADADWYCWQTGQGCGTTAYPYAGMQQLVDAIRGTSATNIIMVGGIQYASSLSKFLTYKPTDPLNNMIAAVHAYDFNSCRSRGCWDLYLKPIYDVMPVVAGEIGEKDCSTDYMYDFMNYADVNGISYLAWAWIIADCAAEPALVTDYKGTATPFGLSLQRNLASLSRGNLLKWYENFPIFHETNGDSRQYNVSHRFDDWSSLNANVNYNYTKIKPHEGQYSVMYQSNTYSDAMLFMCWGCINTDVHNTITFWVHGGGNSGQAYNFRLQKVSPSYDQILLSKASLYDVNVPLTIGGNLKSGSIDANSWSMVTIDLTQFPNGTYDGIRIWADTPQQPIYMDAMNVNSYVMPPTNASSRLIGSWAILVLALVSLLLL